MTERLSISHPARKISQHDSVTNLLVFKVIADHSFTGTGAIRNVLECYLITANIRHGIQRGSDDLNFTKFCFVHANPPVYFKSYKKLTSQNNFV